MDSGLLDEFVSVTGASEDVARQLLEASGFDPTHVHTMGLEPIANGTKGAGLLGATWRVLLSAIGVQRAEVGLDVDQRRRGVVF